ncbi:MAG: hypothetical protein K2I20_01225 [Clostridia bacterium]|nr:hypothetical protein [Clostridia bacterium]MDE6355935.1 hypothetical protein [Clostridia bacterium]
MKRLNKLKTKILAVAVIFAAAVLSLVPACAEATQSSVKSLTKPYIAEYNCVEAKFGGADLLKEYDFIKITLIDDEKMEISFKPKDGEKKTVEGTYSVDGETREMTGNVWIFGVEHREKIKIENGGFTVVKTLMNKPLVLRFEIK